MQNLELTLNGHEVVDCYSYQWRRRPELAAAATNHHTAFVVMHMNATHSTRPLFERIHDALTTNPHVPSQQVQVEAEEGRVVLKGM